MDHPSKSKEIGGIPGAHRVHLSQLWLGPVPRSLPFLTNKGERLTSLLENVEDKGSEIPRCLSQARHTRSNPGGCAGARVRSFILLQFWSREALGPWPGVHH